MRDLEPCLAGGGVGRGFFIEMSSEVSKGGGDGSHGREHSSSDSRKGAWHRLYRTSYLRLYLDPKHYQPLLPLPSHVCGGKSVVLFLGAEPKVQTALRFLPVDSWSTQNLAELVLKQPSEAVARGHEGPP